MQIVIEIDYWWMELLKTLKVERVDYINHARKYLYYSKTDVKTTINFNYFNTHSKHEWAIIIHSTHPNLGPNTPKILSSNSFYWTYTSLKSWYVCSSSFKVFWSSKTCFGPNPLSLILNLTFWTCTLKVLNLKLEFEVSSRIDI